MAIVKINTATAYGNGSAPSLLEGVKAAASASGSYSFESASGTVSEDAIELVKNALQNAELTMESAQSVNSAGVNAMAVLAATLSAPADYLKLLSNESVGLSGSVDSVGTSFGVEFGNVYSTESFDNQNLTEFNHISLALAYTTGQQSPGMEAIYRTITLSPEQGGVDVEVPMLYTQNPLRHAEDGSASDFGFRRVIDADLDHRILEDNVTAIIPTLNTTTAPNFVAAGVAGSFNVSNGRREVTSGFLAVGKTINLFGIGNLDTVSQAGQPNYTEALDRNIGVDKVLLAVGSEAVAFKALGLPFSRFVKGPEQGGKKQLLSFPLSTMIIDKDTKAWNGADLTGAAFAAIQTGEYTVRLAGTLTGDVDVERGGISVNPGVVTVVSIADASGQYIPLDDGDGATIVAELAAAGIKGWTVDARLTNSNQRHLGLQLNVRTVKERLLTKVRSPIWMPFPVMEDRDQAILDYLTVTVQKQKEKDGITQLISYHDRLMEQTGGMRGEMTQGDFELNALPYEGIGRYLINGYVQTVEVNLDTTQALDTNTKVRNAQETLINTMRSVYLDIMQHTNYENGCRFLDGGQIKHQHEAALFGSDTIKRFLTVAGDTRTLGADVPHKVYSTVDGRLRNQKDDIDTMYMVLVREGDDVDVLSSGVMLNTPSLVSALTVTRNGTPVKELVVQPRYAHYNLCPIIVKFEVKGVHKLLKETLPFKNKPV